MYIKCSGSYYDYCKERAQEVADDLWDFQQGLVGDPILTDNLSSEDIEILDRACGILYDYARS